MSMKNRLTDRANVIGEFISANCTLVILTAVPLLIMGGTAAHDWYNAQPAPSATTGTSRQSSPYRSRCMRRDG